MRVFSFLMVFAAALLVPAGTPAPAAAAADFSLCLGPNPSTGWTIVGYDHRSCKACETAGAAGVKNGHREVFLCGFWPIGLDGVYKLYVPTPAAS